MEDLGAKGVGTPLLSKVMSLPASRLACTSKALEVVVGVILLLLALNAPGIGGSSSATVGEVREDADEVDAIEGGVMY